MPETLVDVLHWRSAHQPSRLAYRFLVDGESEEVNLTYEALDRRARTIGAMLQSHAKPGDRALLLFPPGLNFICAYFGCMYSKIIAIPAYPPYPGRMERTLPRIFGIASDATPELALTSSSLYTMFKSQKALSPELRDIQWLVVDDHEVEAWADKWQPTEIRGDDVAFLQYTSGSTTTPKGVIVSHKNLMHNLAFIGKSFGHTSESHTVTWLPLYHDFGLIGGILQSLYGGFPATFFSPVMFLQRPFRWLHSISKFGGTISGGPNFAYDLCVRKINPDERETLNLSKWKVAVNGAEQINNETLERFARYFAPCGFRYDSFFPCYGLAEATLMVSGLKTHCPVNQNVPSQAPVQKCVISSPRRQQDTQTLVSCGHTMEDQEIKIVDPETLISYPPGEVGEIWISGSSVALGYWNNTAETERTFRAYLKDSNEGPFLRTGDLGLLNEGELYVTGRLKELIIIDGNNHYPHDIERTVEQCHPAIRPAGCAAFSVNNSHSECLVVLAELEQRLAVNEEEVIKAIRRAIAEVHEFSVHDIRLLKAGGIPRTSSGKIKRYVCKANYIAGTLKEVINQ